LKRSGLLRIARTVSLEESREVMVEETLSEDYGPPFSAPAS
jgi:hypothetical protein